ncbi:MAG: peptide deformylase [Clostridiales bacterium]|nr:peptide deformylase [Clostridiales bacterium]
MAIRNLRYVGDAILTKKSKEVKEVNNKIRALLDDMLETMHEKNGAGLAAPQVGILKRVVVIQVGEDSEVHEFINPVILESRGEQINPEGCLSVPGESGYVKRPEYVKVMALDRNGEEFILEGEGYLAITISHELDHLDGILYVDKKEPAPEGEEDGD